ncbi:hypothetical protein GCM10010420_41960 [Streptomyces glaucosporus]|uniref:Secreted protein n=1 Tax=Streptomyces glaucosporus TaxID=284044 RepID=A0ABN3IPD5_9ACTN
MRRRSVLLGAWAAMGLASVVSRGARSTETLRAAKRRSHPVSHPLPPEAGPLGGGGDGLTAPWGAGGPPGYGAMAVATTAMTIVMPSITPSTASSFF